MRAGARWVPSPHAVAALALAALGACDLKSAPAPAQGPDTAPPSIPQGVAAEARSPTRVTVAWSPSSDAGTGVAGYEVLRGGAVRATVAAPVTSFEDATVAAATSYTYTVRAFDAASPANVSAESAPAGVTTPSPGSGPGLDVRPSNTACIAPPRPSPGSGVRLSEPYASLPDFAAPILALQAPGDASKWFVVEQGGLVRWFDATNPAVSSASTFVDLTDRVYVGSGEMGLLGMAFHPAWPATPEVFVSYTARDPERSLVSRIRSTDGGATLDRTTEQVIITVNRPARNHCGGNVAFSPPPPVGDGLLYVGWGDGGGAGDEFQNGQRLTTLHAKILRLDVDGTGAGYDIPAGNPHAGNTRCGPATNAQACPEMFAFGFRNPWRWSFDRQTGELWAGDVGQNAYEEIDRVSVGRNYGWSFREGAHCFPIGSTGCPTPGTVQNGGTVTDPVTEYPQPGNGNAITGGYVYRGTAVPDLAGRYVFGDFESGNVWSHTPGVQGDRVLLFSSGLNISSFAESADGELWVVNYGGSLHRFEPAGPPASDQVWNSLADSGCVDAAGEPSASVIPYGLNAPFWSDGAVKIRGMGLPDGETVAVAGDGDWDFPEGTVLVKTFRVGGRLVETRLLMRHPDGVWAGYPYEWNEAQTAAARVRGGKMRDLGAQTWVYPSEQECMHCHTQAAGRSLGLETAQLNGQLTYEATGRTSNQLETLQAIGVFTSPLPDTPPNLPALPNPGGSTGTLEQRARSWLHTNCAQCHRPGGPTQASMDLRYTTSLASTGTCGVSPALGDLGIPGARIVAPGSPATSILLERVRRLDEERMPPVGSLVVDGTGAQLLQDWIAGLTGCP